MTVSYGSEHQACRLDISSGEADSFESGKKTNRVLDEIVEEWYLKPPADSQGAPGAKLRK